MDDGGKQDYFKNNGLGIVFNIYGFIEIEVKMQCSWLIKKYDLECWVKLNKNKYIIVIFGRFYDRFLNLVELYIILCMKYKL